jgi:hypothetical protein
LNRAATLYAVGPRTRTTMQSCASAAELRSGGPILPIGIEAKGLVGNPPPRTVIGTPSQAYEQGRKCGVPSASSNHGAGGKMTPSGTTPCHTNRHRAISSLRAKATIIGLRAPRVFFVRARYHCAKALSFWYVTPVGPCLAERDHCRNGLTLSPGVSCHFRRVNQ